MVRVFSDSSESRRPWLAGLLVGLSAAFLLCGYEFVRSPADSLFPEAYGQGALLYAMAATPLAVFAVLYVYGMLLTSLGARRTALVTTTVSALLLAGCFVGMHLRWRPAVAILFVFREAYVVLLVEQYWSFLNSTFATGTARKLNGPVCGIASVGAILGASAVAEFAGSFGSGPLILLGAGMTVLAAPLMDLAYRFYGEPRPRAATQEAGTLGLGLFAGNRMLPVLLAVILLTQVIAALLYLHVQSIARGVFPLDVQRTAFWGGLYRDINIVSFVLQFGATPLLLRVAPLGVVHLAIPLVHVASCLYLLARPSLATAGVAFTLFKSLDYSTFRAAKEILYIPLSFDSRYRAKEVIDVFGYRLGKGGASLALKGLQAIGLVTTNAALALGAAGAAGLWAVLSIPLVREYARHRRQPAGGSADTQAEQPGETRAAGVS